MTVENAVFFVKQFLHKACTQHWLIQITFGQSYSNGELLTGLLVLQLVFLFQQNPEGSQREKSNYLAEYSADTHIQHLF